MNKFRVIFLLLSVSCFGQDTILREIKLQSAYSDENPYLELLGITDKDALIVKAALNTEANSEVGSYVAFLSNGEIHRYGIFSIKDETVLKHATICSLPEKQSLCNQLQIANRLNQSQLNIKEIVGNEAPTQVYINDADTYYLTLHKGNRFSHFQSEAPQEYIEAKVQGYEQRSDFLDLYNAVDYKMAINTKDIKEIRTCDTVYVYYQKGPYESKHLMNQTGLGIYRFWIEKGQQFMFDEIKDGSLKISDKRKLARIRQDMIDYDFFFKYGAEAQFLRSKRVFIVDALELSQNKVTLKEVQVSFPYPKI